uniref:Uncharacterized protein n=1 Tax=Anguilla anguilla TaxID=7936 RepID=A0A0E9U787_ANGAN
MSVYPASGQTGYR